MFLRFPRVFLLFPLGVSPAPYFRFCNKLIRKCCYHKTNRQNFKNHNSPSLLRKHSSIYVIRCAIWYHLYNFKNMKNTNGGVLFLVKLQRNKITQRITYVLLHDFDSAWNLEGNERNN